jgi:hypothetical protein
MAIPAPRAGAAVLVTGASSGIGTELARQLAARGHDLVLVARRQERLDALAAEIRSDRRVAVVPCDLSEPSSRRALFAAVEDAGLEIDMLALSAGFGMGGPFTAQDPERLELMIRTNLEGVVALTRRFAPPMEARHSGAILIVSSMTGNQPMPNFGAYAATKAAVTSFAEMLHEELKPSGVGVTVLCPGEVLTEFAEVADVVSATRRVPRALKISAADCARAGLEGVAAGRRKVIPRPAVRLLHFLGGNLPRAIWLPLARRLMA